VSILRVYTDGSCHPQERFGGWAAVILQGEEVTEISGSATSTTHNRMELQAVIEALGHIDETFPAPQDIEVFCDSQYVCELPKRRKRLENDGFQTRAGSELPNTDLIKILFELLEQAPVHFTKVSAHQKHQPDGDNWNRHVDKLARRQVRKRVTRE